MDYEEQDGLPHLQVTGALAIDSGGCPVAG